MNCFQRVCARRSKKAHKAFFVYVIKYASSLVSIHIQLQSVGSIIWHLTPERPLWLLLQFYEKMNARLIALLAVAAEAADDPSVPVVVARRRVWVHSINRGLVARCLVMIRL